jgi:pilus assembly protein CpaB
VAFVVAGILAGSALVNPHGASGGKKVVVAVGNIAARTPIADNQVTTANVDPAPAMAITDPKDVVGKIALVDIPQGDPVSANLIASSTDIVDKSQAQYLPIPSGWVAVTIPAGELTGVGGFIQPFDRIIIVAELGNGVKVSVRSVFRDLKVIRVGSVADTAKRQQGTVTDVASSLTVLMTACDAEYLDWLLNAAQLKYVLESYRDYGKDITEPSSTCPTINSGSGVTNADVEARWHFFS